MKLFKAIEILITSFVLIACSNTYSHSETFSFVSSFELESSVNLSSESLFVSSVSSSENSIYNHPEMYGSFFALEDVYAANEISDNDLLNICYRNNLGYMEDDDHQQLSSIPDGIHDITPLDDNTIAMLKHDYYLFVYDYITARMYSYMDGDNEFTMNSIKIAVYCGFYNGYYALRFENLLIHAAWSGEQRIGDYMFIWPYKEGCRVILWKKAV